MARESRKKPSQKQMTPIALAGVLGLIMLLVGQFGSLLFTLLGALSLSGAIASYYEGKASRSHQVFLWVAWFLALFFLCGFLWGMAEFQKRACFPDGDCESAHELNRLEILDHKIFQLYEGTPSSAGFSNSKFDK